MLVAQARSTIPEVYNIDALLQRKLQFVYARQQRTCAPAENIYILMHLIGILKMTIAVKVFVAGLLSSGLLACVSNKPSSMSEGHKPGNISEPQPNERAHSALPALPSNYKNLAATYLVHDYIQEANGPPEIAEPVGNKALFGATNQVMFRYPVKREVATRLNIVALLQDGTYYRCGSIIAHRGISTFGEDSVYVGTGKHAMKECGPTLKFSRYSELEKLADDCRDPGGSCGGMRRTPLGGLLVTSR